MEVNNFDMFEQLIIKCNYFLFVHQYPDGQLNIGSYQHRDLVRAFFAGVAESLMATGQHQAMKDLLLEYEGMCGEGWIPDSRFVPSNV